MEYLTSKDIIQNKKTIVTIGNFDGVHRGHLNLIERIKRLKEIKSDNFKTVVLSFNPHPMNLVTEEEFKLIYDLDERKYIFSELGIDLLIEYPFDKDTRTMSPKEFIENIIIKELNCEILVVGQDYTFGKNKEGNANLLREVLSKEGIEVIIESEVLYKNKKLGSSRVRDIILNGNMEEASELLNKPYFIIGEVIHGKQLGRTIGFPTMNVIPPENKLIPPKGVYISCATIDNKKYNALTNIGNNPTVNGNKLVIESHVLDFNGNAYGKVCKFEIIKKIREERKFNSLADLKNQIDIDVGALKEYLEN